MSSKGLAFSGTDFVITPEALSSELLRRVEDFDTSQPRAGNEVWTSRLKAILNEIALDVNETLESGVIEAIYTGSAKETREFLYDVIWWYRSKDDPSVECLALAAEIEWASFWWGRPGEALSSHVRDRVIEDFDKLVVAKAPLKLMMFCTSRTGTEESHEPMQHFVFAEIDKYIKRYKHLIPGETYLFIDVASPTHRRAWVSRVDESGMLRARESI